MTDTTITPAAVILIGLDSAILVIAALLFGMAFGALAVLAGVLVTRFRKPKQSQTITPILIP